MKKGFFLMTLLGICALSGCGSDPKANVTFTASDYGTRKVLKTKDEVSDYLGDVGNNNKAVENGIVVSPHFTMDINGQAVPVYATRTANAVHSFAYIDIDVLDEQAAFSLEVTVTWTSLKKKVKSVVVLPESNGVTATLGNDNAKATITKTGNFSFVFNNANTEALTLMVSKKTDTESLFAGRTVREIEPGEYYGEDGLSFNETDKVYYFKKGNYEIGQLVIPDNSIIYFEQGAYLKLYPDNKAPIYSSSVNNIGIYGHGLLDYSACSGASLNSETHRSNKGGISLNNCSYVDVHGLMIINAQTWQCCLNNCRDISITDCMFFGYRTYADGIMLSDCKDAVVEDNFIRTGDDAFETKSTTSSGLTERILFTHNSAWTDKAVAYGCIYESNHDTSGVRFVDNSVGFAMGCWSKHLGCAVVQMGDRKGAQMYDITFDGMEIFYSVNEAICNIYIGGSGGSGAGYGYVHDVAFKNMTAKFNAGKCLNLRTYDSANCEIGKVSMDNIVSNDVMLTADNYDSYVNHENVVGGYNVALLTINGERCR